MEERPAGGVASLAQAQLAFDRGDFLQTRRLCEQLLADEAMADEARAQARSLLAATGSDPFALVLAVLCAVFFAIVVYLTLAG